MSRLEAFVFEQRNELGALPLVPAWLAMERSPSPATLALAIALVAAGAALLAWGTLHNRYAQGRGQNTLATGGPYSWLRNPLYVANALVLIGAFESSSRWSWLPAAGLWLAGVYTLTVNHEERRLSERYGSAYGDSCARVGRWLPRCLGEQPRAERGAFLAALAFQSRRLLVLVPLARRAAELSRVRLALVRWAPRPFPGGPPCLLRCSSATASSTSTPTSPSRPTCGRAGSRRSGATRCRT